MRRLVFFIALLSSAAARLCATDFNPEPEALVLIVGDQHSAYERTAQLVARIDQLRAAHPGVPFAVLIDGDCLEYGNIVARRSAGAIDFAFFAALARRVPTILNLGNHEPEFYAVDDTVARIQATGVTVISNLVNRATGQPFAPVSTSLRLGIREAIVVGLATDKITTYRAAVRPSLDPADPVVWAKQNLTSFFSPATALPILLTHTGLNADRVLLELIPDGTLFAGAHDHLRFVHNAGRSVYFHSGSWNDGYSLATLRTDSAGQPRWSVAQFPLALTDPADPELAALIQKISAQHLTPEDLAVLGRNSTAFAPAAAARFVVAALRAAARADAAVIGATTFGAGLPAGEVTRVALDACVRFDGTIFVAEISGAELTAILAKSNQDPATPLSARRGENLVAVGPVLPLNPARRYRLATTDWGAKNARTYFGSETLRFVEEPKLRLKTIAADALSSTVSVVP